MKNYWLIMGGAGLGLGLQSLLNMKNTKIDDEYQKKQKQNAAWYLIGGVLVVLGGLKLFDE